MSEEIEDSWRHLPIHHISREQIQGLLDGDGSVPCSDTTATGYRHHSHVIRVPIRDEEENRVPISIDVSTIHHDWWGD